MRILLFLHSWTVPHRPTPPYDSFIEAYRKLGHDITVVWSNDLTLSTTQWAQVISEARVIRFIETMNPDLVISVNNGGMTRQIRDAIRCPVARWLFDDYPHLFFEDDTQDIARVTRKGDRIFCYTSFLAKKMAARHPELSDCIEFLPHAASEVGEYQVDEPVNLAFVGTLLEYKNFTNLLKFCNHSCPEGAHKLLHALSLFEADYGRPIGEILAESRLDEVLCKIQEWGWNQNLLQRTFSDVVSAQQRVMAMSRLADLGMRVYGNTEWLDSILFTCNVSESFQFGKSIESTQDLMNVYQNAKIVLDVPNIQNINAISNRVFDVMATSALLITKHQDDSDARQVFGGEVPFPMYRSLDHLHELCEYYLSHEAERLAVVRRCNELVRRGHSYRDRAQAGLASLGFETGEAPAPGTVTYCKSSRFRRDYGVKRYIKRLFKKMLRRVISRLELIENHTR